MSFRYKKITISTYRAIVSDIIIPLKHFGVTPMVGKNDSGKTTILKALLAFDFRNDLWHNGEHLQSFPSHDRENDYFLSANITATKKDLLDVLTPYTTTKTPFLEKLAYKKNKDILEFQITRTPKSYTFLIDSLDFSVNHDKLCREIIAKLPPMFYAQGFGDSFPSSLHYKRDEDSYDKKTLEKLLELSFSKDSKPLTLEDLLKADKDSKAWGDAEQKVNETLEKLIKTYGKEFLLPKEEEQIPKLRVRIDKTQDTLSFFFVIKKNYNGEEIEENPSQISPSVLWVLNFILRVVLNSMTQDHNKTAPYIYLLDELGANLHPSAQNPLRKTLKLLGDNNFVLFNTHSPKLLDMSFMIHTKVVYTKHNQIYLGSFGEKYPKDFDYTALSVIEEMMPLDKDIFGSLKKNVIVVEGITDFYSWDMFIDDSEISFCPSTGASNIPRIMISLIAQKKEVIGLCDHDDGFLNVKKELRDSDIKTLLFSLQGPYITIEDFYEPKELAKIANTLHYPLNTGNKEQIKHFIKYIYYYQKELFPLMEETKIRFQKYFTEHLQKLFTKEYWLSKGKEDFLKESHF